MAEKTLKGRSWCITVNQSSYIAGTLDYDNMESYLIDQFDNLNYACWNEEKGATTGNIHMHVYIEVENAISKTSVIKKFNKSHVERRFGNPSEARLYVEKPVGVLIKYKDKVTNVTEMKDRSGEIIRPIQEIGNWDLYKDITARGNSRSKDKEGLNSKFNKYIEEYNTLEEIESVDLWFANQYRDAIRRHLALKRKNEMRNKIGEEIKSADGKSITILNRKFYYLYGDSQAGKSFGVLMENGVDNVCIVNCAKYNEDRHIFDMYETQSVVNFNEFRSQLPLSEMLNYLDPYDVIFPARYYHRPCVAYKMILTSNWDLKEQYSKLQQTNPKDWIAFKNRFLNGVWKIVIDEIEQRSYIYCQSTEADFTGRAKKKLDFSIPPLHCDGVSVVHIKDADEFSVIEYLIGINKPTTAENITLALEDRNKIKKEEEEKEIIEKITIDEVQRDNACLKQENTSLYEVLSDNHAKAKKQDEGFYKARNYFLKQENAELTKRIKELEQQLLDNENNKEVV